ncbi:ABC transporter substrate-binding protein [Saccharospirillum salsuginis]|uniref:ABC transporter extracellular-binding protein YurO n=1 Tax=Saccharospirillum salsuginis TaxID=418750 RepID=A0A918K0V2_9GAMM|nr:extracellular solute-binding protein [Saccharospirillum salsuginis]GGX40915.1 putative ABC transporter extracellular-binding protein YurO [Saccharospirillum salsuginis]
MFKRTTISNAILVMAVTGSSIANAETIELDLFHRWPNEPIRSFIEARVEAFERQNPNIEVNIDQVLNDSYKDKLRVILGSSNAPDVFFSWSGEFGDNLARNGNVLSLESFIDSDRNWLEDNILLSQVEPFRYDGEVYGLPWQMNGKALFYNVDLYEQAGLAPPQTFDDLLASCETFKDMGAIPVVFSSKEHWAISHWVGTFNERIVEPSVIESDYQRSSGRFTDPAYVTALEELKRMVDSCSNQFTNATDHSTERSMFIAGRAAMNYLEYGEIRYLEEDAGFDWASTNFPVFENGDGQQRTMQGAPEGYMVSAKTQHPEASYRLIKFLVAGETAEQLTATTGFISSAVGAVTDETASSSQVAAAEQIADADGMYLWLDNALDIRIVNAYMNGVQLMLEGSKTAEQVMRDVQRVAAEVRQDATS